VLTAVSTAFRIASSSECVIFDFPASFRRTVDTSQRRRRASLVWPPVPRSSFNESQIARSSSGII
jgi:hypothetical protein